VGLLAARAGGRRLLSARVAHALPRIHNPGAPGAARDAGAPSSLAGAWAARARELGLAPDGSQLAAVERLARYDAEASVPGQCALRPWAYLYGPVGSGKTLLLDTFAQHARDARRGGGAADNPSRVLRAHFHDFMITVHQELHALQARRPVRVRKTLSGLEVHEYGEPDGSSAIDTLAHVAKSIADARDVVCLDELHVTDLADALILSRLCQALLQHGVRLVFTSNQSPSKLFESGSNRTRYVGVLAALLRARCVPVKVGTEAGVDYRALAGMAAAAAPPSLLKPAPRTLAHRASGRFLAGKPGRSELEAEWVSAHAVAGGEQRASVPIAFSRSWSVARVTQNSNAARLHFSELCAADRGAADYLALAKQFETLFVEDVPALSRRTAEEARRLITLVDVCYDAQLRLVLHTLPPREQLFAALRDGEGRDAPAEGELSWMISRCMSRLSEMTHSPAPAASAAPESEPIDERAAWMRDQPALKK